MRKPKRLHFAILFASLSLGIICYFAFSAATKPATAESLGAQLELASGIVVIDNGGESHTGISGEGLRINARIVTDKGSRAWVRWNDGTGVLLRENTTVQLGPDGLEILSGEIFVDAPALKEAVKIASENREIAINDAGVSILKGDAFTAYVARGEAIMTTPAGRSQVHTGEKVIAKSGESPTTEPVQFWEDWTGGADALVASTSGSGRIYGVDAHQSAHGTLPTMLDLSKQKINITLRDGIAETEVDQTFFNSSSRDVEGWYWFTLPEGAFVTSFALETNGTLVEGRLVESKKAAADYQAAKGNSDNPAILEWIDSRTLRARIYPIRKTAERRVVLRYAELLSTSSGKIRYVYPMRTNPAVRIDEFSLTANLGPNNNFNHLAASGGAQIAEDGSKVSIRRSGYVPRTDFVLEAEFAKPAPLRVARFAGGQDEADYVMLRLAPEIDWQKVRAEQSTVALLLDTSAGMEKGQLDLAIKSVETILRSLSPKDRFAVYGLDLHARQLFAKSDATKENIELGLEALAEADRGGATDLKVGIQEALEVLHGEKNASIIYIGDGLFTTGAVNKTSFLEKVRRSFEDSDTRLFSLAVGDDADQTLLEELATIGGGKGFFVPKVESLPKESARLISRVKAPVLTGLTWEMESSLDESFVSTTNKIGRNQELVMLGRSHQELPKSISVKGKIDGAVYEATLPLAHDNSLVAAFVPRLWAMQKAKRLMGENDNDRMRGRIAKLGINYGIVTPFTSFLALDSEASYARYGISDKKSPHQELELARLAKDQDKADDGLSAALMDKVATMKNIATPSMEAKGFSADSEVAPTALASAPPVPRDMAQGFGGSTRTPSKKSANKRKPERGQAQLGRSVIMRTLKSREAAMQKCARGNFTGNANISFFLQPNGSPQNVSVKGTRIPARAKRCLANIVKKTSFPKSGSMGTPVHFPVRLKGSAAQVVIFEDPYTLDFEYIPPRIDLAFNDDGQKTCSDVSARPLRYRARVWENRLATAHTARDTLSRYIMAVGACEVGDWRSEALLLRMMAQSLVTQENAEGAIAFFSVNRRSQRYLAKQMLRRSSDPMLSAHLQRQLFGNAKYLDLVERMMAETVDPIERLEKAKALLAPYKDDPRTGIRLLALTLDAGDVDAAVRMARRFRSEGFMTPWILKTLGDTLAERGQKDEAIRAYSEIVEFNSRDEESRLLVGDLYLARSWYDEAYEQYKLLSEMTGDSRIMLRLARAAAGAGRVDEALRIERAVASASGQPGKDDPRRFARIIATAQVSALLSNADVADKQKKSLKRELLKSGLFSEPGTLVILSWENLRVDPQFQVDSGELHTYAPGVGVLAVQSYEDKESFEVSSFLEDELPAKKHIIRYDGKDFQIEVKDIEVSNEHAVTL